MHLQGTAAELAEALAEERERNGRLEAQLAAIPAPVEGPRVDLEKMHLQGTAAELAEALAEERERNGCLEADLNALRAEHAKADTSAAEFAGLRADLVRESERRVRLERDLKDIREGWAYDVARRRT
jgi:chromosome segregation ATPase